MVVSIFFSILLIFSLSKHQLPLVFCVWPNLARHNQQQLLVVFSMCPSPASIMSGLGSIRASMTHLGQHREYDEHQLPVVFCSAVLELL